MTLTQPVIAFDLDRDVRTAEAMGSRLTPYIYETELYGPMPGDLPRLTVGSLLMRLHRLKALDSLLSERQRSSVQNAQQALDDVRKQWGVAYEGKLQHELEVRLKAINQFLSECRDNPTSCAEGYPSAIEKAVIAHELADDAESRGVLSTALQQGLLNADNGLHRLAEKNGRFVWDQRLEAAYPREKYWYLYLR
jgi:hypothetical protein